MAEANFPRRTLAPLVLMAALATAAGCADAADTGRDGPSVPAGQAPGAPSGAVHDRAAPPPGPADVTFRFSASHSCGLGETAHLTLGSGEGDCGSRFVGAPPPHLITYLGDWTGAAARIQAMEVGLSLSSDIPEGFELRAILALAGAEVGEVRLQVATRGLSGILYDDHTASASFDALAAPGDAVRLTLLGQPLESMWFEHASDGARLHLT